MKNIFKSLFKSKPNEMKTSFSDNSSYPNFCLNASIDDNLFRSFRRNPTYNKIVELLGQEFGSKFLNQIQLNDLRLKEMETFKKNDEYGDPKVFNYKDVGIFSPTTLMYIKILYQIENLFGSLDNKVISEIGVGYGGQARILSKKFKLKKYNLFDLFQVLELAKRYLNNFGDDSTFNFLNAENVPKVKSDFVLSNFAFSELRREVQECYLNNVILNSDSGFIIHNDINPKDFKSYGIGELLEIIPSSSIIRENPLTSAKNCIIIWGQKT